MNRLGFRAARSYNTFNLRDERSLWSCEEHAAIGTLKNFGILRGSRCQLDFYDFYLIKYYLNILLGPRI